MLIFFDMCCYFLRVESIWTSSLASCNRYHAFSTNTNLAVFWLVLVQGTLTYIRAFLCVQPDTRFCMPLSIRSWKHDHPLWGHGNLSIWLSADKCGSCFRVALRAISKLAGTYLTIGGRCVYYKSEKQIIVAYMYAMNHFGLMDIWLICNIGSGQLLPLDVRTGSMVLKVYRIWKKLMPLQKWILQH